MSKARELASLGNAYSDGSLSNRNKLINGAMVIDQRNGGAAVTPAGSSYTLDRWRLGASAASKVSVQQSSVAPEGFSNSALITSVSAYTMGAIEEINFGQRIEGYNASDLGWGTASAKAVTLSFWVRSSLTGLFSGAVKNADGTRSYAFTYSISTANTWEYKSVTIQGDTSGTWSATNSTGVVAQFMIAAGSSLLTTANAWASGNYAGATGATNLVATNGATIYLTGVQLEVGDTATPFEHRSYGQELALCQRYYWNNFGSQPASTVKAGNSPDNRCTIATLYNGVELQCAPISFNNTMRTSPSIIYYKPAHISTSGRWGVYGPTNGWGAGMPISGYHANQNGVTVMLTSASGVSDFQSFIVSGYLEADAEL